MSGETTVIPGKTHDESSGEKTDLAKINLVSKPSVRVNEQSIGTRELMDGGVTVDKLSAGVLAEINAAAFIPDGSITCAKLAAGAVCYSKRDTNWDDVYVQRDTILSTVGNYLRYSTTGGVTEEVTLAQMLNDGGGEALAQKTTDTASPEANAITLSNDISVLNRISGTVTTHWDHTSAGDQTVIATYEFLKISGSWAGSINTLAHGAGGTTSSSAIAGTTSLASGTLTNTLGGFSVTVAIAATTLTATVTSNQAVDNVECSVTAVTQ
jgi:hypothetical protein